MSEEFTIEKILKLLEARMKHVSDLDFTIKKIVIETDLFDMVLFKKAE